MSPLDFYAHVSAAMQDPPVERHARLRVIHQEALAVYVQGLAAVSADQVARPQPVSGDARTVAEIVAHIEAWDRFALMAAGDVLAGIRHPRMVTDLSGYVETDGSAVVFASIDAFNDYQARRSRAWTWDDLKGRAVASATTLYALFEHPTLLNADRLEAGDRHHKRLHNGTVLNDIAMGWHLWLTMIEHIAVEHRNLIEWMAGMSD